MGKYRRAMQEMFLRNKWRILRGDKVQITAGKDRGQVGTVLKVLRDSRFPRVIVEGLNLSKRFMRRTLDNPGGVVSVESPLHYSNVRLLDPVTGAPVRVSWRYTEAGEKVRVTTGRGASGSIVPRPDVLKQRRKPRNAEIGPRDTAPADAAEVTHRPGDLPSFLREQLAAASTAGSTAGAAGGQQHRHYSTAAVVGGSFPSSGALGSMLGTAQRLLGGSGRAAPLRGGALWRGFAASAL